MYWVLRKKGLTTDWIHLIKGYYDDFDLNMIMMVIMRRLDQLEINGANLLLDERANVERGLLVRHLRFIYNKHPKCKERLPKMITENVREEVDENYPKVIKCKLCEIERKCSTPCNLGFNGGPLVYCGIHGKLGMVRRNMIDKTDVEYEDRMLKQYKYCCVLCFNEDNYRFGVYSHERGGMLHCSKHKEKGMII